MWGYELVCFIYLFISVKYALNMILDIGSALKVIHCLSMESRSFYSSNMALGDSLDKILEIHWLKSLFKIVSGKSCTSIGCYPSGR